MADNVQEEKTLCGSSSLLTFVEGKSFKVRKQMIRVTKWCRFDLSSCILPQGLSSSSSWSSPLLRSLWVSAPLTCFISVGHKLKSYSPAMSRWGLLQSPVLSLNRCGVPARLSSCSNPPGVFDCARGFLSAAGCSVCNIKAPSCCGWPLDLERLCHGGVSVHSGMVLLR